MKSIIPCLFIITALTQCTKDNPGPPDPGTKDIFNVTTDPNYLLDSLIVRNHTTKEGAFGYFFSYDNLNRVTSIKYYDYFFDIPLNNEGIWTFNYQGNNTSPQSMDQVSYENFRVYFFYNANGSKNRDSIVSPVNPAIWAVRKYAYDSAFKFAVAKHYNNGSLKASLEDSASFKDYNCTGVYSKEITWTGSIPYSYEWYNNTCSLVDNKPNPLSKMNIFPALFLSPYLQLGYTIGGKKWSGNHLMDMVFQNNPLKYRLNVSATGGYNWTYIKSAEGETYDAKNRIIRKNYADSSGNIYSVHYDDRFYATYKYR